MTDNSSQAGLSKVGPQAGKVIAHTSFCVCYSLKPGCQNSLGHWLCSGSSLPIFFWARDRGTRPPFKVSGLFLVVPIKVAMKLPQIKHGSTCHSRHHGRCRARQPELQDPELYKGIALRKGRAYYQKEVNFQKIEKIDFSQY